MSIPINRDFDHSFNYSSLESKTPEEDGAIIIDIPHDTSPSSIASPLPSPQVISSWQRMFSNLPNIKKNLLALAGVAGLGGASVLAAGLSKGDQDFIIVGSSACSAAFLMALSTVFPKRQSTQTMESVITHLHQLVDKYPDLHIFMEPKVISDFEFELRSIFVEEMEEIPVSARGKENREILFKHCQDVFMKFSSFDNLTYAEDMEKTKVTIKNVVQDFCKNAKEVDTRIEADKQVIKDVFFQGPQSLKTFQIQLDSGETHHQGKQVAFVTFNGDEKQRVVYKPRDMRIDAIIVGNNGGSKIGLFQLVNTLIGNKSKIMPTYKFLNMEKDGKRYGYTEFLSHEPSDYKLIFSEMRAYYRTMGAIQAVSQLFGITDLHRQNILVHTKKPFPIDLEVSFDLQALQQDKVTPTGLDNAIREYGIPTIGGGTKSTPNKVGLVEENGEIISMQQHYLKNKDEFYLPDMGEGFEIVKNALMEKEAQDQLKAFIDDIPDDLQIRFVPLETGNFLRIIRGRIDVAASTLMDRLNESCRHRPPYQIKSPVNEEQALEDILHGDIPRMVSNMYGKVFYNNCHFLEAIPGEIKPILLGRVKQMMSMVLDENFKNSLHNFHQN